MSKRTSRYENIFKDFLDNNKISYVYQYSLNQCRDVLPLPFDFYISDYDILVEIDGEGHYKPCHFNNISKADAIKTFKLTKKHDNIKNDFCKKNKTFRQVRSHIFLRRIILYISSYIKFSKRS